MNATHENEISRFLIDLVIRFHKANGIVSSSADTADAIASKKEEIKIVFHSAMDEAEQARHMGPAMYQEVYKAAATAGILSIYKSIWSPVQTIQA